MGNQTIAPKQKKPSLAEELLLTYKDSNLECQNQKLVCYRLHHRSVCYTFLLSECKFITFEFFMLHFALKFFPFLSFDSHLYEI